MGTALRLFMHALVFTAAFATSVAAQDSGPGRADHGRGELKGLPPQDNAKPENGEVPFGKAPIQVDPFYKMTLSEGQLDSVGVDVPVTRSFQGIADTGWSPPDPIIAAGPDHIVACTNAHVAYFTKEGTRISQTTALSFFGSMSSGFRLFDPWVIYDKWSNRFMVMFTSTKGSPRTASRYYIAISKTSDPTKGWWLYWNDNTLNGGTPTTNWADYPRLSTDKNAIYITGNMFGFTTGYQYSKIRIMQNKSAMLAGGATQIWWDFWNITMSGSTSKAFTILPCHDYDTKSLSADAYFVSCISGTGSNLYYYAIKNVTRRTAPTPTMAKTRVAVISYASPGTSRQKGGTRVVENVAPRLMNAVKVNGSIWCAHSVKLPSSFGAGAGVKWYEVKVNSWPTSGSMTKRQDQNYHGGTDYYYTFPSVAVNENNDMSIVFCRSHTTLEFIGCRISGRLSTGALNILDNSTNLKTGEAYYVRQATGRNRWGDYLGNSVDPQGNFWFIGQYAKANNRWSTWIGTTQHAASRIYVPDASTTTGGCNVIPFGNTTASPTWGNQKYQQLITASDLGNECVVDICDLGFVSCGTGTRHFDRIQIRMAQTDQTTLGTSFSANLDANLRTVLDQRNYDWSQVKDQWSQVGLESSYRYDASKGKNLVIQVLVYGAKCDSWSGGGGHRSASRERVYAFGWASAPPATGSRGASAALKVQLIANSYDVHNYGVGCKGSNNKFATASIIGSGKIGTNYTLRLSDALPNANTFISVGFSLWSAPFDLSLIQAPGCNMYFNNLLTLNGTCNSIGMSSTNLSIPSSIEPCLRIYFQYFPLDRAANPLGLTTTNYARLLTGH